MVLGSSMKKLLFIKYLSLFLAMGHMASSHANTQFQSGLYLGAHGGHSHMRNNALAIHDSGPTLGDIDRQHFNFKKDSGFLGFHTGYLFVGANQFTAGLDVTYNLNFDNKFKQNTFHPLIESTFRNDFKKTASLIPSFSLGYVFQKKYHIYGGFGVALTRFKMSINNVTRNSGFPSATISKNKAGISPIVGFDYLWTPHISLKLKVAYEYYDHITISRDKSIQPNSGEGGYTARYKPRFITTYLGITYRM
jgi:opacity protein-like surface antigen